MSLKLIKTKLESRLRLNSKYLVINNKSLALDGFTMIELLIVMAIIAILLSISVFAMQGAREQSRDAKRKGDLEAIRSAIELYKSDCNTYPNPGTGGDFYARFADTLTGGEGGCNPANANIYMSKVPQDPSGRNYYYSSDGITYTICAGLEETTTIDSVCNTMGADCGAGITCSYHVTNP